nr:hypothetical protein [uncultured Rhodopila sp.]
MNRPATLAEDIETDADRRQRIAREAALLEEARAEIAAGLAIDAADIEAWIESIGTDHELPPPYPRP